MTEWSLSRLLASLHNDIQQKLAIVRSNMGHPGAKGDASEHVWIKMLDTYLPQRYKAENAFVVDSNGNFSDRIDVVIFDRQYSPFIFRYENQTIVPAESVYAVFEAKQSANADMVRYAQDKVRTVRRLHRTSLPIPHAGGTYPPKSLIPILGGLLTFESDWSPPLGPAFEKALLNDTDEGRLDVGCVASHGYFFLDQETTKYSFVKDKKPATAFLFKLISQLQFSGTVPMIDIEAYAKWLVEPELGKGPRIRQL